MNLAQAPLTDIEDALRGPGLALDLGIVRARVRAQIPEFSQALQRVYGAFPLQNADAFCDITATILPARGLRRWVQPQIQFYIEGETPFEPFPARTHLPMLEWGLNWIIAQRFTDTLLLHAGVVERDGQAIILPAMPGSGKSTLTAALVQRGYRLLSDEFGAVDGDSGRLLPAVRPVALKNESIEVIRNFAPKAVIGPAFPGTRKGTVAHMAPDPQAVEQCHTAATARVVLFPRYDAESDTVVEAMPKSRAFAKLSVNSFNYELRGPTAFSAVAQLIEQCDCYQLAYSDLDDAINTIGTLLGRQTH